MSQDFMDAQWSISPEDHESLMVAGKILAAGNNRDVYDAHKKECRTELFRAYIKGAKSTQADLLAENERMKKQIESLFKSIEQLNDDVTQAANDTADAQSAAEDFQEQRDTLQAENERLNTLIETKEAAITAWMKVVKEWEAGSKPINVVL